MRLFILLLALIVPSLSYHKLKGNLLCSACKVLAREISDFIKKHEDDTSTVQKSHRLSKDNKPVRVSYKESELRAVELLEELCDDLKDYQLRQNSTTYERLFTTDSANTSSVDYYDDDEREYMRNWRKDLEWSCHVFVDENNDALVKGIRNQYDEEQMTNHFCLEETAVCDDNKLKPHREQEQVKREKWQKAKKKEEKRKAKEKAEREKERLEKERIEKEEAEKAEKEKAEQEGNTTETQKEGNENLSPEETAQRAEPENTQQPPQQQEQQQQEEPAQEEIKPPSPLGEL